MRIYADELESPLTISKILNMHFAEQSGWRLLEDFQFEFRTFEVKSDSSQPALGVRYSFARDLRSDLFEQASTHQSGIALSINANGNVAFSERANPADFLESDISLHVFRSQGGAVEVSDEIADRLDQLESEMADIEDADELDASPMWKEFLTTVSTAMTTQLYLDLSLTGGLESNQAFTQRQYAYGAHLGIDLKAWNRQSILARWNVIDWPFAALRWLSGYDSRFESRGSTFPTLLAGIDYVDPVSDHLRFAVGDSSDYTRFKGEIAFKTPIARAGDGTIFVEADYRYCLEFNPSEAVEAADLDASTYFIGIVSCSNGLLISYREGRLPFDAEHDQVYELGFRFTF